jgi:peptidoglycan/LPS O-acetylase OafA/YrhL
MYDPRSTAAAGLHQAVEPLPALTSLRFFAAAYVVAFHFTPVYFPAVAGWGVLALGYSGVTFFFLLSGFILAYNYKDVDFRDRQNRRMFYGVRLARIYPVYLLALAAHVPWFLSLAAIQPKPLQGLMLSGLVLAPLGLHAWIPGAACSLDCPSWSVSVELFFYALFPLLLPLVLRDPARIAVATLALWVATVALATLVWGAYGGGVSLIAPEPGGVWPVLLAQFIKYFPPMHLPVFIAGLLLFVAWRHQTLPAVGLLMLSGACAVLIVAAAGLVPDTVLHNGLTVLVWAPLILACASLRRGLLCSRPLVFLGRISFALYLLHIPVLLLFDSLNRTMLNGWLNHHSTAALALTLSVSLAVAALVHVTVEEPARRWLLRGGARPSPEPVRPTRVGA